MKAEAGSSRMTIQIIVRDKILSISVLLAGKCLPFPRLGRLFAG